MGHEPQDVGDWAPGSTKALPCINCVGSEFDCLICNSTIALPCINCSGREIVLSFCIVEITQVYEDLL